MFNSWSPRRLAEEEPKPPYILLNPIFDSLVQLIAPRPSEPLLPGPTPPYPRFKCAIAIQITMISAVCVTLASSSDNPLCQIDPQHYLKVYLCIEVLCVLQNLASCLAWLHTRKVTPALQFTAYALDLVFTNYQTYGCFLILFLDHSCSDNYSLSYLVMLALMVLASPKVSVYFIVMTLALAFSPCLIILVISSLRTNPRLLSNLFGNLELNQRRSRRLSDDIIVDLKVKEVCYRQVLFEERDCPICIFEF